MAGGPLAQEVVCFECLETGVVTKAVRVSEGVETDHYVCEKGHSFGVDYRRGPAEQKSWPPPPELVEAYAKESSN